MTGPAGRPGPARLVSDREEGVGAGHRKPDLGAGAGADFGTVRTDGLPDRRPHGAGRNGGEVSRAGQTWGGTGGDAEAMVTTADPARRTLFLGIGSALAATCFFSVNDTSIKFLSGDYALHQIVLIRSLVGFGLLTGLVIPLRGEWHRLRTRKLHLHLARSCCVILSNFFYFLGLAALPIATSAALFFIAPLLITALSVPLLGEKVGPRRWAAVGVGLVGVVVMLRPGMAAFQPAMILPLLAAFCYAMLHMMTRRMGGTESAVAMTFYNQASFVLFCTVVGLVLGTGRFAGHDDASLDFLTRAWSWPAPRDWPILALTGLASMAGGIFISQAYRSCEAGLIAPFEYVSMPLAIVAGLLVFHEWPDAVAWLGIALICGSGLYIVWRETRRHPDVAPLAAAPSALRSAAVEGRE